MPFNMSNYFLITATEEIFSYKILQFLYYVLFLLPHLVRPPIVLGFYHEAGCATYTAATLQRNRKIRN